MLASGLAPGSSNTSCGTSVCDEECEYCEHAAIQVPICEPRPCFDVPSGQCECPRLSEETLVAVGAVVLCLVLLLLAMAMWHWQRCDFRPTTVNMTEYHEGLLPSNSGETGPRLTWSRPTRGRTSIDSTVSCIVCMDYAINCVLMPCAHEVACMRCSQHLRVCPVCRTAVESTMKIQMASQDMVLAAALERSREEGLALDVLAGTDAEMSSVVEDSHWRSTAEHEHARGGKASAEASAAEAAAAEATDTEQQQPSVAGAEQATAAAEAEVATGAAAAAKSVEMLCLRCGKLPPNCLFVPCAHKVWCVDCAAELPPACPICNTGISQSLRTFHKRLG